jgi:CheY-like chemotaxis protein
MRPRKRVVVIDANETGRNVMGFVLDIWGYRVHRYASAYEAWKTLSAGPAVVIVAMATAADRRALTTLRKKNDELRVLAIEPIEPRCKRVQVRAEVMMPCGSPMIELRERVRVLHRRRGMWRRFLVASEDSPKKPKKTGLHF